jgi:hypothetical protein
MMSWVLTTTGNPDNRRPCAEYLRNSKRVRAIAVNHNEEDLWNLRDLS